MNIEENLIVELLTELRPEEADILGAPTLKRIANGEKIQSEIEGGSNSTYGELVVEIMRIAEFVLLSVNIYLHLRESKSKISQHLLNKEFSEEIAKLRSQHPQITENEEEIIIKKIESMSDESNWKIFSGS